MGISIPDINAMRSIRKNPNQTARLLFGIRLPINKEIDENANADKTIAKARAGQTKGSDPVLPKNTGLFCNMIAVGTKINIDKRIRVAPDKSLVNANLKEKRRPTIKPLLNTGPFKSEAVR